MHTILVDEVELPPPHASLAEPPAGSVIVATLDSFESHGQIRVRLPGNPTPLRALSAVALSHADIGTQVLLAFGVRPGDIPVITGRASPARPPAVPVRVDGERVVLQASREIELRCGDASIVLTRAGKILIRGAFVLTHARGMNRIRGACVHIN